MPICSHCQSEITVPRYFIHTDEIRVNTPKLHETHYVLCSVCYNKLEKFLKGEN
jgi:hypothetical protein